MTAVTLSATSEGLREFYGRGMNLQSDVYKLPADSEEQDRLTLQHRMWKLMLGGVGFYPPEVEDTIQKLLSPRSDKDSTSSPSILDLGSGSGIWTAEISAFYPHAKVVGLDLTEPKLRNLFPPNCSFVLTDLTKGLDEYRESFDVVHCRCVAGHMVDRVQLMQVIAKVLKPGGLLLIGDGNLHLYSPDGSIVPPASLSESQSSPNQNSESEGSWASRWFREVIGRQLSSTMGPEYAGGEHVGVLVRKEPAIELIGSRAYFSPVRARQRAQPDDGEGRKEECEREEELAQLTGRNILNFLPASKPILLAGGVPEETVGDWLQRTRAEIIDPSSTANWSLRWDMAWAVKRVK